MKYFIWEANKIWYILIYTWAPLLYVNVYKVTWQGTSQEITGVMLPLTNSYLKDDKS